ncbi:MAG: RNA methyltransferase [Chlorobi bacterium]|nr:RNA methyltransferase [Chlorobiota bacterium]
MNEKLIQFLKGFITEKRFNLFNQLINNRTKYITVALEDIYQPHNASAVLRSCDCFGIQNVHIIEDKNKYIINPDVALGSSKWLTLKKHNNTDNNTLTAINTLKKDGYRIIATTPHSNTTDLENFNLENGKIALFFGTELKGLSKQMLDNADEFLKIPMYGFTESFNISVSAAIILHHLTYKLRNSEINWNLNEEEKNEILISWLKSSIKNGDQIEKDFLNKFNV